MFLFKHFEMSFIPVMAKLSQHHYPDFSVRWSFRNQSF